MKNQIAFPLSGGMAGVCTYSTFGGIGIVGGFGGMGIGMVGMTAAGTVIGSAIYGAVEGIENRDATAFTAIGLGAIGGAGVSATFGGVGVSFSGSALGLGMGSMAAMGGIFGLGIYGLAKMFSSSYSEPITETFSRMEEKIAYEEAYYQAMIELSPTLAELSWKQKFAELEIAEELEVLKAQIEAKNILNCDWNPHFNSFDIFDNEVKYDNTNIEPDTVEIELKENFVWKSLKILKGHTATINSLAIKDNIFVSGSDDRTVNLWNIETGQLIFSFFEPSEVSNVAISDRFIVAGNKSRKITSWQLKNKTLNRCFSQNSYSYDSHDGLINAFVLSSDFQTLYSGSADRTIRIWNLNTGQLEHTLNGHTDSVLALAISPCDRFLYSGSADKTIKIWNLHKPTAKPQTFTNSNSWVTSLAITNDGKYLVSGGTDSRIKLWNLSTKKLIYTISQNNSAIWSIAISPDGKTIVSSSIDKTVIWELATGNILQTINASTSIIFNKNGKYLITANPQNRIEIWQRSSQKQQFIKKFETERQWWKILKINKNTTTTEIKAAYYKLARQYHPDINPSYEARQMMQIINLAYCKAQNK